MADAAEDLLLQALKLPDSERRILALWLLDSAGDDPPEEVERAWVEEARRRLDQVRNGNEPLAHWHEARRRIFSRS